VEHMLHNDTWTVAATFHGHIIGYVKFVRRTSVMVEMTVGFHPQFRGRVARACVQDAIAQVFRDKGMLKIYAAIPDDNKAALAGIRRLGVGFVQEGRLTRAIVREGRNPPLADLLIFGLSRGDVP
jgi:RimJ/RimL family protein N-acetyltransferase